MPRSNAMGRTANGVGSIRKKTVRRNGKEYIYWEGRCTTGYDPLTGKQIQRSVSGHTQKEVRQAISKIMTEVDDGCYIEPTKQTVSEWLDTWLDTYISFSVKPYTEDAYRAVCKNHIKPLLGNIKLMALSAPQIQQFYNVLLRQKGLSPKTIKNVHGVLHRALNQAVKIGMIRTNPSDVCDLPRAEKVEIKPMEDEQISKFLAAIKDNEYEVLFKVTLFTGLRQGEVLGLTWDCVDFENETLCINKQLQKTRKVGGEYALVSTKNDRTRLIPAAHSVMTALRKQKSKQAQMHLLAGSAWDNKDNLVFTNELGGHLTHRTVYKYFKDVVRELGMEHVRFHDLRHSYAVVSIENGDDIKTVQENLGHATAAFTLNVYAHATMKMQKASAERMEKFIQSVS